MKRSILAFALATVGAANASSAYETSFEGGWFDPAQSGRGAMVDYIPQAGANGAYFVTLFTYDNTGAPLWLTIQGSGPEGQRVFRNAEVRSFRGGNFGVPFTAPNPASGTLIGTATMDFATCTSLTLDVTSTVATIPSTRFTYGRLGSTAAASTCPFEAAFTACPAGTTAVAGKDRVCEIAAGTITSDLRLTNNASYELNGRVQIGSPLQTDGTLGASQANLFVEPGTVIRGRTPRSYLVVNGGSRIFAEGSASAPIIFTGLTEVGPQSSEGTWGGLIIAGRAPINRNCTGANSLTCRFEADQDVVWGGSNINDSSGALRYVQIRSAGGIVTPPDRDLNALTLGGVGNGTVVEFVQAHDGTDDGFEMFGGTVDLRHIVATGNNDDSLDTDFGYVGKIQYAYVRMDAGSTNDSQGIETDNGPSGSDFDAIPRTRPVLVNATFDGQGLGFDAIRIRRGSGYVLQNVVAFGYIGSCINLNDAATYLATAPAGQPTQVSANGSVITGSVMGCTRNFDDVAADPWAVSAWFNGQTSNAVGDLSTSFQGRLPRATSPLLRSGATVPTLGGFLQNQPVRGAFANGDWTDGWTTGL